MTEQTARTRRAFWVDPAHDPRDTDELPVGETTTLRHYLDRYRMTFEMKCEGLTSEQLATRSVPPSTMSLLGLVRHLAKVEHHWFRRTLEGQTDLAHLYHTEEEPDLDFAARSGPTTALRTPGSPGGARWGTRARSTHTTTTSAKPSSRASRGRCAESSCT